jgi:hypothetical protein
VRLGCRSVCVCVCVCLCCMCVCVACVCVCVCVCLPSSLPPSPLPLPLSLFPARTHTDRLSLNTHMKDGHFNTSHQVCGPVSYFRRNGSHLQKLQAFFSVSSVKTSSRCTCNCSTHAHTHTHTHTQSARARHTNHMHSECEFFWMKIYRRLKAS